MAIKRRFNELQDLAVQSVQNEFSGPVSPYFTISELPNPVPQGKSSFLIDGADELFVRPVKTKTQVSIFMQQQSGSHHSVSP